VAEEVLPFLDVDFGPAPGGANRFFAGGLKEVLGKARLWISFGTESPALHGRPASSETPWVLIYVNFFMPRSGSFLGFSGDLGASCNGRQSFC